MSVIAGTTRRHRSMNWTTSISRLNVTRSGLSLGKLSTHTGPATSRAATTPQRAGAVKAAPPRWLLVVIPRRQLRDQVRLSCHKQNHRGEGRKDNQRRDNHAQPALGVGWLMFGNLMISRHGRHRQLVPPDRPTVNRALSDGPAEVDGAGTGGRLGRATDRAGNDRGQNPFQRGYARRGSRFGIETARELHRLAPSNHQRHRPLLLRTSAQLYGALTTRAQHQSMKIRGDSSAVSKGPDRDYALLAAFLDATNRIDRRALQRTVVLSEAPQLVDLESVNLEAQPISLEASPTLLEADPASLEAHPASPAPKSLVAPYTFRRANLVRA